MPRPAACSGSTATQLGRPARLLRREQPRARDPRRHAVHGHARRASRRDRCAQRPTALEYNGCRLEARVLRDDGAARHQGQRASSARAAASTASAASSPRTTCAPAKRCGASTRFRRPGEPGSETWSGDDWEHGGASVWVTGSYDPELNLTYWGIGNPGPRLEPRPAPRRQPVLGLRRRARRRHRRAEVALPVHAERRLRLRRRADPGARRPGVARHAAQADALGEPQRLLLRARSRDRRVPAGHAVRQSELGQRPRRERPADSDAATAGRTDLAGQPGRHELVLAVVQPAARSSSISRRGSTTRRTFGASSRNSSSAGISPAAVTAS